MQRVKAETSSTDFIKWRQYFKQELKQPTRQEQYLAQIAAEMRRTIAKHPKGVNADQFVLTFTHRDTGPTPADTEKARAVRLKHSKAFWMGTVLRGGKKKAP